jgi:DNA-binding beta-propeller fold protein YncE
MIMPDFWGEIDGEKVWVTAVLERTVVYVDGNEKKLTKRENVLVDPRIIEMRPVANTASWRSRGKVIASKAVPAPAPVVPTEPTPEALAAIEQPETPKAEGQA